MNDFQQLILKGQILSGGIGYGRPVFLDSVNVFEENKILEKEIEDEIAKFKKAVNESKKQISQIKKSLSKDKLSITFDILNTQLEIINDPLIFDEVTIRIKKEKKSIESVLGDILLEYKKKIKDPYFREKALDIADVFKRITINVKSIKVEVLKKSSFKSIIISSEIIPSDAFEIDSMNISAFISLSNSYESHAAIIARSKNIPFISNVNIEKLKSLNLTEILVDADKGKIVANPTIQTHEKYQIAVKNVNIKKANIKLNRDISLYANVSNMAEINQLIEKKIKGIGLLRTELLFLENKTIPSEQIQYEIYKEIASKLDNRPLIIRLFDLGGDKSFFNVSDKTNTDFFGCRGVRFLLKNKKILEDQITAILKANVNQNIYILIPFVKDIEEIKLIKNSILKLQKVHNVFSDIKIGSMIEIPAAALISDEIIKEVDFLSIGTNDLSRYTLASQNLSTAQIHQSLIKLIKMIVSVCKENEKPLFLCGEMIANTKFLNQLIELGVSNFSIALKHLDAFEYQD